VTATPRPVAARDVEPVHDRHAEFLAVAAVASEAASDPFLDVRLIMAATCVSNVSHFARLAGVSRQTVHRWLRQGLDYWTADRLSVKVAGTHPALIFGPGWFGIEAGGRTVAA